MTIGIYDYSNATAEEIAEDIEEFTREMEELANDCAMHDSAEELESDLAYLEELEGIVEALISLLESVS